MNTNENILNSIKRYSKFRFHGSPFSKEIVKTHFVFLDHEDFSLENFVADLSELKKSDFQRIIFIYYSTEKKGNYEETYFIRHFFSHSVLSGVIQFVSVEQLIDSIKSIIIVQDSTEKLPLSEACSNLDKYCASFKKLKLWQEQKETTDIMKTLAKFYKGYSYHSQLVHEIGASVDDIVHDALLKNISDDKTLNLINVFKSAELFYDIGFTISQNPLRFKKNAFKILFIDDKQESIEKLLEYIYVCFPLINFAEYFIAGYWSEFLFNECELIGKDEFRINVKKYEGYHFKGAEKLDLSGFTFIAVDLLMNDTPVGLDIIRNLQNLRRILNHAKNIKSKPNFDIIALSRSQDVEDIGRALNEGAVYYLPKSKILRLPGVIAQLADDRKNLKKMIENENRITAKHRNFGKLYQLPVSIIRRLQAEPFLDLKCIKETEETFENEKTNILRKEAKDWIKELPKADIHFHLGGSMNADMVFNLSLNSIRHIDPKDRGMGICETFVFIKAILDELKKGLKETNSGLLENIFENIQKYLDKKKTKGDLFIKKSSDSLLIAKYLKDNIKKSSDKGDNDDEIKKLREEPEEFLLKLLKRHFREKKLVTDDYQVINLFNVLLGILEGREPEEVKLWWDKISCVFELIGERAKDDRKIEKDEILEDICSRIQNKFEAIDDGSDDRKGFDKIGDENKIILNELKNKIEFPFAASKGLLKKFITVGAAEKTVKNLKNYLRGCAFMGSELLQFYENIIAAVFYIIDETLSENIRYLEIRCSPDGYTKRNLTLQNAVEALFDGADLASRYFYLKDRFTLTNFIFTAKRHKSPEELAIEIASAIVNRNRPKLNENKKNIRFCNYQWQQSRLVGIDLAGLEKGLRPALFQDDFLPLQKTSFFITVHAGEEDSARSIWEAIYLLHANRIGHGLTLYQNKYLLDIVKNLKICIELNPYSNKYTNEGIVNQYPIFDFVNKGINVSIGTDDKAVSGTSLSDEYVLAAELYQDHQKNTSRFWLSKWEIVRLVKNSFVSAFIHKEEKRSLLKAVEEEMYLKLIKLERHW